MGKRGKPETASPCHALDKSRLNEETEISPHAVTSAAATKDAEVIAVTMKRRRDQNLGSNT
jgi:hypothetical protein